MATDWSKMTVAELDEVGDEYVDYPSDGNKTEKVAWLEANVEEAGETEEEAPPQTGAQPSEDGPPELAEGQEVIDPDSVGEEGLGVVPVVYSGTWVRLGEGGNVPEECWGHVGFITFAPVVYHQSGDLSPRPYEEQGEGKFIVHTRDEFGYDLQLEKTDFSAMSSAGRHEIMAHA